MVFILPLFFPPKKLKVSGAHDIITEKTFGNVGFSNFHNSANLQEELTSVNVAEKPEKLLNREIIKCVVLKATVYHFLTT